MVSRESRVSFRGGEGDMMVGAHGAAMLSLLHCPTPPCNDDRCSLGQAQQCQGLVPPPDVCSVHLKSHTSGVVDPICCCSSQGVVAAALLGRVATQMHGPDSDDFPRIPTGRLLAPTGGLHSFMHTFYGQRISAKSVFRKQQEGRLRGRLV